ncbi:MAG: hypothetical protein MK135_12785 [Polyangiaceae bacterium]|nr:hypothetical protein [Polyangiaceae bacterium]
MTRFSCRDGSISSEMDLLEGEMQLEARDGYLLVTHRRSARSLQELDHVLQAIDRLLRLKELDALLFDSRQSDYTPPDIQTALWAWLKKRRFRKVAVLVKSSNLAVSLRMTGLSEGVNMRAFDSELGAVKWLKVR